MTASDPHDLTPTSRRDGSATLPRRGYTRPPFAAGNLAHVTHGTRSERLVSERAQAIHAALLEVAPWVTDLDIEAVDRYCRAEGRARMLHEYATTTAAEKGVEAVSAYVWAEATRAEANAAKFGADLGLDPSGRARLAKDMGVAVHFGGDRLADLTEQGRAIREKRQAELADNVEDTERPSFPTRHPLDSVANEDPAVLEMEEESGQC